MKDKLLFGTIGLLVGVVVMQWAMPPSGASVVTPPVGGVVASSGASVLMIDGSVWYLDQDGETPMWRRISQVPIPVEQVQFFSGNNLLVDKNGDVWLVGTGDVWVNRGQPPVAPVATSSTTFGKVKALFQPKGDKP